MLSTQVGDEFCSLVLIHCDVVVPRVEDAFAAGWPFVLVRLAYLAVGSAFGVLRLLPMSDREKDAEILALRASSRCCNVSSARPGPRSIRRIGRCLRRC
jgi:hypothetical protein